MTFKLIGNELVGQKEVKHFGEIGYYDSMKELPRYTVEEKDLEHFRSKEVWEDGEFELHYQVEDPMGIQQGVWLSIDKKDYRDKLIVGERRIIARPLQTITPDSGKAEAIRFAEWIEDNLWWRDDETKK